MLHAVILLPLALSLGHVAPAPVPVPVLGDRLLAALPPDTFLSVHATNPRALVASRDTNEWVAFALDRQWDRVVHTILDEMGDDVTADEVLEWRDRVTLAFGDSTEAAVFVAGDFTSNEPTSGILVQGGPEASAILREFLGNDAAPSTIAGGRSVLLSEAGRGELYYEHEGLILVLSSPTLASARAVAAQCLDALDAAAGPAGPFAIPGLAAERRTQRGDVVPAFEIAVDLGRLWPFMESIEQPKDGIERRTFEGLRSIEWGLMTMSFGDGETAEWSIVAPYGETTLVGQFLGFFGTADKSLLGTVPARALSGAAIAFDVAGFVDWVLDMVEDTSPETAEQIDAGLSALSETTGIDVMGQIVRNMGGDFLYFASPENVVVDGVEVAGVQAATLVATVDDSEPLIDIIEQVLDMTGLGVSAELGESAVAGVDGSLETWRVTGPANVRFAIATGAQRLALSVDPVGFDAYLKLAREGAKGASLLSNPALRKALASADGAAIGIQPTASVADALEAMVAGLDSMARELNPFSDEPSSDIVALSSAAGEVAALVRQYFEGTTTTEFRVGEGRMRFRTIAR